MQETSGTSLRSIKIKVCCWNCAVRMQCDYSPRCSTGQALWLFSVLGMVTGVAYLNSMAELGSFVPLILGQQAVEDKGVGGYPSHHLSSVSSPQHTLAACEAA